MSSQRTAVKGLTEALSIELESLYGIRAADTREFFLRLVPFFTLPHPQTDQSIYSSFNKVPGIINTNLIPEVWVTGAVKEGAWRLIEPVEVAQALWSSWLDDPAAVDGKGVSTKGRLHWYVPEELQDEVDARVNVRGMTEVVREEYKQRFANPNDPVGQLDKK